MRLRLSRLAIEDLALIHDYTVVKWGEEQGVKYAHTLWDSLEEIAAAPDRWRLRPDIYDGCRVRAGLVEIGRILHGAMNLRDHIPGDFMGHD